MALKCLLPRTCRPAFMLLLVRQACRKREQATYFLGFNSCYLDCLFLILNFLDTKKSHSIHTQILVHFMAGIPFFSLSDNKCWFFSLLSQWHWISDGRGMIHSGFWNPDRLRSSWPNKLYHQVWGSWAVLWGCWPSMAQRMVIALRPHLSGGQLSHELKGQLRRSFLTSCWRKRRFAPVSRQPSCRTQKILKEWTWFLSSFWATSYTEGKAFFSQRDFRRGQSRTTWAWTLVIS